MAELSAACEGKAGTQFEHRLPDPSLETGSFGALVYLPTSYCAAEGGPWPLVFHLHGGGESEGQAGFGPLTADGVNTLAAVRALAPIPDPQPRPSPAPSFQP